jgi:tetratricopeptide (TPR) repeat protein
MKRTWLPTIVLASGLSFSLARPAVADEAADHYNLGLSLKRQGKTAAAIEEVKLAVSARQNYAAAWFTLGNLYRAQGDYDNALQAYQKCIALQPANADARANLGALFIRMKRVDEGIK